jgi:hypothetical protein
LQIFPTKAPFPNWSNLTSYLPHLWQRIHFACYKTAFHNLAKLAEASQLQPCAAGPVFLILFYNLFFSGFPKFTLMNKETLINKAVSAANSLIYHLN